MSIQRLVIGNLLPTMCSCWGLTCPVVSPVLSASMGEVFAVPDVPVLILFTCRIVGDADKFHIIDFSVPSMDVIVLLDGFCSSMGLSVSTLGCIASCVAKSSDKCSSMDCAASP